MSALPTYTEKIKETASHTTLLRFSTAGSVDDGKSTLIGRLLHDSNNVYEDHLAALEANAKKSGSKKLALALLTDGLKAEREQGITIDVAYRYFSTPKRRFILADSPGHVQYTRNMATGASTVDLTIVLIDASQGVVEQTKRHAFIAALLGVPRLLIAVNKMDLVDYSESRFDEIRESFTEFSAKLGVREVRFIPVCAVDGDNIVTSSQNMPWYNGETVLEHLEGVYIAGDQNLVDFRFPVQSVINPDHTFRGYAGTVSSGVIRVGEEVVVLPSMQRSKVKSIVQAGQGMVRLERNEAASKEAIVIQLEDQIDVGRGSMLVRPKNLPKMVSHFEGMVVWLSEVPLEPTKKYLMKHTTRETKASISSIEYKIDIHTLGRVAPSPLEVNEIGRIAFSTTTPLFLDPYQKNRATGNFILIDPDSFLTVGAGMIIDRGSSVSDESESIESEVPNNLHSEIGLVSRQEREERIGEKAVTLWLTGLSGSGKSTIAKGAERALFDSGSHIFFLDGDNLRQGLNSDLGFSRESRVENIRRAAGVARLMNEAGVSVICAFISPFASDRKLAAEIIGSESFFEIFVDTPVEVCEQRDPHGLYAKFRKGAMTGLTGVDAPYEAPTNPNLLLRTDKKSVDQNVEELVGWFRGVRDGTETPR
jgi:bifunctional enzyme CysN/CysC